MAERPGVDTGDDTGERATEDRPPGTPGWVKVFGIIVSVALLLIVGLLIFGGGGHGPARHVPGSSAAWGESMANAAPIDAAPELASTADGLALFEPGTYVGSCAVPGHREAGMELEIVVAPPGGPGGHTPPSRY